MKWQIALASSVENSPNFAFWCGLFKDPVMQISILFGIFCGGRLHLLDFYFKLHVEINRKALDMCTYKCFRPRIPISR
ncbi:hypothetical protein ACB092_11G135900 [Castanea dentata]